MAGGQVQSSRSEGSTSTMALIWASGAGCERRLRSRSALVLFVLVFRSVGAAGGRDPKEEMAEASVLARPGKACSVTGGQSGPWSLFADRGLSPGSLGIFRGSGQEGRGPRGLAAERSSDIVNLVEEGRMAWAPAELGRISSRNRLALPAMAGAQGEVNPTRRAHDGRAVGLMRERGLREPVAAGGEGVLGGSSLEATASMASPPTSRPTGVLAPRATCSIVRRTND